MENFINKNCVICEEAPIGIKFIDTDEVCFVKCPNCSLIWKLRPEQDPTDYKDESYFSQMGYNDKRKRKLKKSFRQLKIIEKYKVTGGSLLEIGCSKGYFIQAAAEKGWQATGVDISDSAVEYCKSVNLEAYKIDIADLPSLNKKFDVIVLKHVFEHLSDPVGALKVFMEILNDNGLIFLDIPHASYYKAKLLKDKSKYYNIKYGGAQHYYYYTPETMEQLFKKMGFKVLLKSDFKNFILGKLCLTKQFFCVAQKKS
jgi:2-polyprenyl-3-methyl-5-hydroxy-6-metoxy-1,4-benzoquinol methylase